MHRLLRFSANYGFAILLLALLLNIVLIPVSLEYQLDDTTSRTGITILVGASLLIIASERHILTPAIIIAIPAALNAWLGDTYLAPLLSLGLTLCYFIGVTFFLLYYILTTPRVKANTLFAAMCLYLIIALNWAYLFTIIELWSQGSFIGTVAIDSSSQSEVLATFIYFSIVTLSTLGFGDITPVSPLAQTWTAMLAIVGQFFMTIVLARLVALYLLAAEER